MISVAMATYNGEKYIKEQLQSIINQTYKNIEIVICDDCSTDSTCKIIREYQSEYDYIRLYENKTNLGFKRNFENVISKCNGEYIALCDQDDIWINNHLEKLLSIIGSSDIACGNALLVDSDNNSLDCDLATQNNFDYIPANKEKLLYRVLLSSNPFQGASMLIRKSFFEIALPIPDNIRYHDVWFATLASIFGKLNYCSDIITRYRQHFGTVTNHPINKDGKQKYKTLKLMLRKKYHFYSDRFDCVEDLKNKFGDKTSDLINIYYIFDSIKAGHINMKAIKLLWENYSYIKSRENHKGFVKEVMLWKCWTDDIKYEKRD